MKFHGYLAFAVVLAMNVRLIPAQESTRAAISENTAAERIPNLGKLKAEIEQYHDCRCNCGCYAHDIDTQADRASAFLRKRATHKRTNEKLALILDIDETTLSNYQEELRTDFGYSETVFDQWIQTAQAPAIAGTLRLYKEAQRLGVSIFFVTGREEKEREATEKNLRAQGFDGWQQLIMRPVNHGKQTIGEYKSIVRGQIVAQGYTLALNVGDQWSDLKGEPEAEFSVKYPDPFYFIP
jgi:acid phosphatase